MEIWKDIKGFEGFYQVSNAGDVRSIAVRRSIHGSLHIVKRIREMAPYDNGNGYLMVQLKSNNTVTPVGVHRLVAEAFVHRRGEDKVIVNHKDHNTKNNIAENLEWVTQRENVNYSKHLMRHAKSTCRATNTGEKYIRRRNGMYEVAISQIRAYKSFKSLTDAITYRDRMVEENALYFERG